MYTILQQQKCGSSTCTDNEKTLNVKDIFITSHFSHLSSWQFKYIPEIFKSLPYRCHFNDLKINNNSKTIAIIRNPFNLISSHYHQFPMGCMNIKKVFRNFKQFVMNIEKKDLLHPLMISTHYPLFDKNFNLLKIDYLLHLNDLDNFLNSKGVPALKREKVTPDNTKAGFDDEMRLVVENYYDFEIKLSNFVKNKGLVSVKSLDDFFFSLPEKRINEISSIFKEC